LKVRYCKICGKEITDKDVYKCYKSICKDCFYRKYIQPKSQDIYEKYIKPKRKLNYSKYRIYMRRYMKEYARFKRHKLSNYVPVYKKHKHIVVDLSLIKSKLKHILIKHTTGGM